MEDRPIAFTEHLQELRSRLIKSFVAIAIAFFGAFSFHHEVFLFFARPVLVALRRNGVFSLQALDVTEAMVIELQASLVAGLLVSAPYWIYQIWAFVAPGLYKHEKHLVRNIAFLVSLFFALGVLFAYMVFVPLVVEYLVRFTNESSAFHVAPTISKTLGIVLVFAVVFGIVFQLPLLMFLLSSLGIVKARTFIRFARYFIVFAFIIGAIFTPPDVLSQILLALPLCVLFFVGIAFSWAGEKVKEGGGKKLLSKFITAVTIIGFASLVLATTFYFGRGATSHPICVPQDSAFLISVDKKDKERVETLGALLGGRFADALLSDDDDMVIFAVTKKAVILRPEESEGCKEVSQGLFATTEDSRTERSPAEGDRGIQVYFSPSCVARLLKMEGEASMGIIVEPVMKGVALLSLRCDSSKPAIEKLTTYFLEKGEDLQGQDPFARAIRPLTDDAMIRKDEGGVRIFATVGTGKALRFVARMVALAEELCVSKD
jgi:sec-independent protein translocase protein TatC